MSRFRKRPIVIEAQQLIGTNAECFAVYQWVESHIGSVPPPCDDPVDDPDYLPKPGVTIDPTDGQLTIRTLEGDMKASVGDWIIQGVQGEFYPCRDDIFRATYEAVES